jgi:hypothetical protein
MIATCFNASLLRPVKGDDEGGGDPYDLYDCFKKFGLILKEPF